MTKLEAPSTAKESRQSFNDDPKYLDSNDATNKKKKRKKRATICTTYCKFEIVRRTAKNLGMKEVPYNEPWNVLWTDYSVSIAKIKVLKGYQRVNHFPGMAEICHKALLAKNLNRMAKLFPKQYDFFPKTWCFPSEYNDAIDYSKKHAGRTYILKPGAGCRGQGIQLTKNFRCLPPADKLICQIYISKPFLVDCLKFDLRVYTLVTSCDPLRIYVYNEGLARFATAPYRKPAGYNLANCYMHLTNYSVNKYSSTYVSDGECGTKRRLSCLNQWLSRNLYDVDEIWSKIDDVIVKTIISALSVIKHSYQVSFPNHDVLPACFEILGFDILLDCNLNPYVLEVNHSPSFNTDSKVDEEIKIALLEDTFKLLNLPDMDTQKILEQDKRRAQMRLQNGIEPHEVEARLCSADKIYSWEEGHRGNYRRVYPVKGKMAGSKDDPYRLFIDQASNLNILVSDNNSSKAREQVSKIQRDQMNQKDQLDQLLKIHTMRQQQYQLRLPEISLRTEKKKNEPIKVVKQQNEMEPKIISEKRVNSASKQKKEDKKPLDNGDNTNPNKIKEEEPEQPEKPSTIGSQVESLNSDINLVILEDVDNTKENKCKDQKADYFAKKLYKRLKESGHMPGAFYPSSDSRKLMKLEDILHIHAANKKNDKAAFTDESHKHKAKEEPKLIAITNKKSKNDDNTIDSVLLGNDVTLRFHSRAATEFLKFQKLKLLRKFQDLT